ncbi:MAG TPA: hypothetical protein VKQ30_08570 [Ktedonobacterales bacterium]|nr:hypothetical protein [Ktedonobacterales bacterium]
MNPSLPADSSALSPTAPAPSYLDVIRAEARNPERLEQVYQTARKERKAGQFATDMAVCHTEAPENVLYAAWYYRLRAEADEHAGRLAANWRLAVPLSVALGLAFWLLSDPHWMLAGNIPLLALLWMPLTALALIWFLAVSARQHYVWPAGASIGVVAVTAYVLAIASARLAPAQQYLTLMVAHVPLLAAVAIGLCVLGWASSATNRFAFLSKSIETIGTAGVFSIAGGIFATLTYGMFQALNVEIPEPLVRLLLIGGAGLIPVLAVTSVYDPALSPEAQEFRRGFGKILAILMQVLVPLTLLVLVIYICVIPFNFAQPFNSRNVLIIYNVLLFAIMGLLVGATPMSLDDYSPRYARLLRIGIIAVAALVLLVSLYALAAILYRTALDGLTMNRLTVIGWNTINIALLALLLFRQARVGPAGRGDWVAAIHRVARTGTALYVVWALLLTLGLPWLFLSK